MGYRIFTDSHGTEWQTWDVVPLLGERRVNDRRSRAQQSMHTDRRMRPDRRVVQGKRAGLTAGMDAGWLCFETLGEKRRLTPIPADWLRCAVARLEQYCAQATRARRVAPAFDVVNGK